MLYLTFYFCSMNTVWQTVFLDKGNGSDKLPRNHNIMSNDLEQIQGKQIFNVYGAFFLSVEKES